jgi:hypothetical protein
MNPDDRIVAVSHSTGFRSSGKSDAGWFVRRSPHASGASLLPVSTKVETLPCEFCGFPEPLPIFVWLYPQGCVAACLNCRKMPLLRMLDLLAEKDRINWCPEAPMPTLR